MRRTQLTFEIRGSNHKDLVEQARIRYAEYVGVPDTALPPATSMEASPEEWLSDGTITSWRGEVTVAVTA